MTGKSVYLDTTFLHYGADLRGIPQVIFQLLRLIVHNGAFQSFRFIATKKVRRDTLLPLGIPLSRIDIVPPPLFSRDIRFHGFLCSLRYRGVARRAAFILHPEYRTVLSPSVEQMVVFHDLIFLDDYNQKKPRPGIVSVLRSLYRRYSKRKLLSASRARHIVAVSEYTRGRLLSLFPGRDPASVAVLHNGIRFSGGPTPLPETADPSCPLELLCVGGIDEHRKNYAALFKSLPAVTNGRPFRLRLAGKCPPEFRDYLLSQLPSRALARSVVFHGLVPDDALRALYAESRFFLFPSLAEGFGLPLLEAMAHGLVACAFNNTSIPEVVGDAAVLAADNDFASWGEALSRLAGDAGAYTRFSAKARLRAQEFSEEAMLRRYEAYLRRILRSGYTLTVESAARAQNESWPLRIGKGAV